MNMIPFVAMKQKVFFFALIMVVMVRFVSYSKNHHNAIPDELFKSNQKITGIVVDNPDRGIDKVSFTMQLVPGEQFLGNRIIVTSTFDYGVEYGDEVYVTGNLKRSENFITETGREFDYVHYLSAKNVYATMRVQKVEVVSHNNGFIINRYLFKLKRLLLDKISLLFNDPKEGLFAGIILGEKSLMPKEVLDDFQVAGLTHMVVLSGYNITLVISAMVTILAYGGLGYRARRIGGIITIPLFIVMTGLGASSIRAGLMSFFLLLLQIIVRPAHQLRIIFYVTSIIAFCAPRMIIFDPGFHLSMLAFLGLLYVVPIFNQWFKVVDHSFFLKKILIETAAVQLFVMPYILWMSGSFSLLLLVANVMTVPLVPIAMMSGFVGVISSFVWERLGAFFSIPAQLVLGYIIQTAHTIAKIPKTIVVVPPFGVTWMIVAYGILIVIIINNHQKKS